MKQGWEIKKLGEVCSITMGQSPSSDTYNDSEGLPFFQGNADFGKIHPSVRVYCNAPIRIADVDDILISVRAPIGAINIADCKCCIGRGLASIRNNAEVANEYIYHALIANKEKLIAQGTGSTFKSIGKEALKELSIPIPPREEQERIVAELDCLSGVIEKKREQLRELDALAQSIFYQMFGDPITNEKRWEVKKLGEVCISDLGKTLDSKKNKGNLYNYLCSINVQWGYFDLTTLKEMRLEESELERYSVKQGDLLICEGGDTGRCAIWNSEEPMYYQNALHRIRFTPNTILPILCQYIMLYMKQNGEIDEYSKGQTIKHLVKSALMSMPFIMPPVATQQEFADKIESIEKQKELIKKSISETETIFNARMDYYFN